MPSAVDAKGKRDKKKTLPKVAPRVVPWVRHGEGCAITSVHIDHHARRVATAGDDRYVKIWSWQALIATSTNDSTTPPEDALLAALDTTCSNVHVARFANALDLIAVGTTSGKVSLWKMCSGPVIQDFGSAVKGVENWSVMASRTLHKDDVFDLAWSPGDDLLASAGVDNYVLVLNVKTGDVLRKLQCDCPVKGVAWDPFKQYLSAQVSVSTDAPNGHPVVLWNTTSWKEEVLPREKANCFIHAVEERQPPYLRHSWSCDGKLCMLVHATTREKSEKAADGSKQYSKHASVAMTRGDSDLLLVEYIRGPKPVFVARSSPKELLLANEDGQLCVEYWAICSMDRVVTVWVKGETSPAAISQKECFIKSILDLAWCPDGIRLLGVSECGKLGIWTLEEQLSERGKLLSPALPADPGINPGVCIGKRVQPARITPESVPSNNTVHQGKRLRITPQPLPVAGSDDLTQMRKSDFEAAKQVGAPPASLPMVASSTPTETMPAVGGGPSETIERKRRITPTAIEYGTDTMQADGEGNTEVGSWQYKQLASQSLLRGIIDHQDGDWDAWEPDVIAKWSGEKSSSDCSLSISGRGRIVCRAGSSVVWTDDIAAPATAACANDLFAVVAAVGGILHVYDQHGIKQRPPLLLGSNVVTLQAHRTKCLLLTAERVLIWDFAHVMHMKLGLANCPEGSNGFHCMSADLPANLREYAHALSAEFSTSGAPVVRFDSGCILLWDISLQCWMEITSIAYSLPQSEYRNATHVKGCNPGELSTLLEQSFNHKKAASSILPKMLEHTGHADIHQTRQQLEHHMAAARLLASQEQQGQMTANDEAKSWDAEYERFTAGHLSQPGMKERRQAVLFCIHNNNGKIS